MTVYVCPERDIECGDRMSSWCKLCPKRNAVFDPALLTDAASPERLDELRSMVKNFGAEFLLPHAQTRRELYLALTELKELRDANHFVGVNKMVMVDCAECGHPTRIRQPICPACSEEATAIAPIACVIVGEDDSLHITMYAPGLPPGQHDLFPFAGSAGSWGEWQPIESAPKDGARMLVMTAHGDVEISEWVEIISDKYEPAENGLFKRIEHKGGFWNSNFPTHWMPLPRSPSSAPSEHTHSGS